MKIIIIADEKDQEMADKITFEMLFPLGIPITRLDFSDARRMSIVEKYPEMEPLVDYGDHMTMEAFVACCKDGGFVDSDGSGTYATATKMSNVSIHPSDIVDDNYDYRYSHVVWFNK